MSCLLLLSSKIWIIKQPSNNWADSSILTSFSEYEWQRLDKLIATITHSVFLTQLSSWSYQTLRTYRQSWKQLSFNHPTFDSTPVYPCCKRKQDLLCLYVLCSTKPRHLYPSYLHSTSKTRQKVQVYSFFVFLILALLSYPLVFRWGEWVCFLELKSFSWFIAWVQWKSH